MAAREGDAFFGDGFFGKIIDLVLNPENKDEYICKVKPAELTAEIFGLDINDKDRDTKTGAYTRKYKRTDVHAIPRGPSGTSYFVLCDFNGNETPLLENMNIHLTNTIKFLNKRCSLLEKEKGALYAQSLKKLNQPDIIIRQAIQELQKVYTMTKDDDKKRNPHDEE